MAKKKKGAIASSKKSPSEMIPETSKQSAVPAKEKSKADELPFTLYIPTAVMKHLKVLSATDGISIKKLINDALTEKYKVQAS